MAADDRRWRERFGRRALIALAVRGLLIAGLATLLGLGVVSTTQAARRPNVLVFVSDDQTRDTVTPDVMPTVYRDMVTEGVSFPVFTDASPICCPSRASIMTGRYNHNNLVYSNDASSAQRLDQRSTIQCYLHAAGYKTGFYGKFLNGYPITDRHLCLDDFAINAGEHHKGLHVNVDGHVVLPAGYLDEFDIRRTKRFLSRTSRRRPWDLWFSDSYPHSPYVPRPKYADDQIPPPPGTQTPALQETDVTDKPAFVQAQYGRELGKNQTLENELLMLRTVDDHFRAILTKVRALHELGNTIVVYVSDNGYLFGEHGLWGKAVPYPEATNVPMMIRYPRHFEGGRSSRRNAQNIDIAPTIRQVTGIHPKLLYPFDGRSLRRRWSRPVILTESLHKASDPTSKSWQPPWRSITNGAYQYTEWRSHSHIIAREYYDLINDPNQLRNLLGDDDPANDPDATALHLLLRRWSHCAGRTCR